MRGHALGIAGADRGGELTGGQSDVLGRLAVPVPPLIVSFPAPPLMVSTPLPPATPPPAPGSRVMLQKPPRFTTATSDLRHTVDAGEASDR